MMKLGIDIGATGIKAAIVDTQTGRLTMDKIRILTPTKSHPKNVGRVVKQIVRDLQWEGQIGIGFPGLIHNKVCKSVGNLKNTWVGIDLFDYFSDLLNRPVKIANDADVAGLAEMKFGNIRQENLSELIMFLTLGTGIGSALFFKGQLIPNVELGHIPYKKGILEEYISNSARQNKDLSWEEYGCKLNAALEMLQHLFSPQLMILGGGISKKFHKFGQFINEEIRIQPAELQNNAGVIGACIL